jgi:dihydropteroate synthase
LNNLLNVNIDELMVGLGNPVRVMGVINLSPESFYKKSVANSIDKFQEMIDTAVGEGADIIDIGGASTAPKQVYNRPEISVEKEIKRVAQALGSIKVSEYPPLSIDTTASKVAEAALDFGVSMINDVSGLHADTKMAKLVADRGVPVVLMANCGGPCQSVLASVTALKNSLDLARNAGIESRKIILDPGVGFGKPPEVDIRILQELDRFVELNHPLLVGVSRKAFIGHILAQPNPENRLVGSIVATTVAVMNGASIIRTHDVRETKAAVQIGEALLRSHRN